MRILEGTCRGFADQMLNQVCKIDIEPDKEPERQKDFKGKRVFVIVCEDFEKAGEINNISQIKTLSDQIVANQMLISEKLDKED